MQSRTEQGLSKGQSGNKSNARNHNLEVENEVLKERISSIKDEFQRIRNRGGMTKDARQSSYKFSPHPCPRWQLGCGDSITNTLGELVSSNLPLRGTSCI